MPLPITGFAQPVNGQARLDTGPVRSLRTVDCSLRTVDCRLWSVACSTSVTSQTVAAMVRKGNKLEHGAPKTKLERLYATVVERSSRDISASLDAAKFMAAMSVRVEHDVAMELFGMHWGLYFNGEVEPLMADASGVYRMAEKTWAAGLPVAEAEVYGALGEGSAKWAERQFAFRLMRTLAATDGRNSPVGFFFLSQSELADRCGIRHSMQARRMLNQFLLYGIIKIEAAGSQLSQGKRGDATLYKWTLI